MTPFWEGLLIGGVAGLFIGTCVGMFICSLCAMAARGEECARREWTSQDTPAPPRDGDPR